MTPSDDEDTLDPLAPPPEDEGDGEGEGKGKSGKGKAEGEGKSGFSRGDISPAFFQLMTKMGATMDQITRILREWVHLKGSELRNSVSDFARDIARASAHAQVSFDGDYGIVTNFLTSQRPQTPAAQPKPQVHEDQRPGPR